MWHSRSAPASNRWPVNDEKLLGRVLSEQLIDYATGEVVGEAKTTIDAELFERIKQLRDNPDVEVEATRLQCATTRQILEMYGERKVITDISLEGFTEESPQGNDREFNYFTVSDLMDVDSKKVACAVALISIAKRLTKSCAWRRRKSRFTACHR
jgi:hypothetical protein